MLKTRRTEGDTGWFVHDRFGLFIHWGLYALGGRHEWVQNNEEIPVEEYDRRYFRHFDPDLYDPDAWAKSAAQAGMKYFVVTTKHHEGFCLWDTKQTDYKAPNTPAGSDLIAPMVEAFQNHGLRTGFYHSLIDWHHPDYVIDPHYGPYRKKDRDALNRNRDQNRYTEYLHAQVRELLTQYGKIDILWFDFSFPKPDGTGKGREAWHSERLYKLLRELAPNIILNDRLDLPDCWDIKTPEQVRPREWIKIDGTPVVWEACQTFSGSWGYHREEASWKSVEQLVGMLVDTVSKGGNLLLNVGPTGRGEFDERALNRLAGIGEWMKRHSRSIYGCTQAPEGFQTPEDCRLTYNPATNRMYVHVLAWPYKDINLDGFDGRVEYAQLLHDASELKMQGPMEVHNPAKPEFQYNIAHKTLTLKVPTIKPNVAVPVIELFMK